MLKGKLKKAKDKYVAGKKKWGSKEKSFQEKIVTLEGKAK